MTMATIETMYKEDIEITNTDGLKYLSDYEGEFGKQPGLSHGYGKAKFYSFNSPDWDDEEYEGNFKNDYYHGQGTLINN